MEIYHSNNEREYSSKLDKIKDLFDAQLVLEQGKAKPFTEIHAGEEYSAVYALSNGVTLRTYELKLEGRGSTLSLIAFGHPDIIQTMNKLLSA